ncbi:MAG: sulfotransferase [Caldilineaceae bacterium]
MTIKVIGAGMGRTGTATLKVALETLGFTKCYHSTSLADHPTHGSQWISLLEGKPVDWDRLYAGYQGTMGLPTVFFYKEIMAHYPEAKVILTVRDPESWYESASQTILKLPSRGQMAVMRLIALFNPKLKTAMHILPVARKVGDRYIGNDRSKAHLIDFFNRHNSKVRQTVPPEKLLEYDVKQGWEPLCQFLDVPVPATSFPHTNTRAEFQGKK